MRALIGRVHVGEHRQPGRLAHFSEYRETLADADAARGGSRGAVGLVEAGLVDQRDAGRGGHLAQGGGDLQRVGAGFDLAGTGDQHERPVVGDRDGADAYGATRGTGDWIIHGARVSQPSEGEIRRVVPMGWQRPCVSC